MKPKAIKNYNQPIILIRRLEDGRVVVIDRQSTIRFVDRETLDTIDGFKAKIQHKYYKNRVIDFAPNGKYFGSITPDAKETRLYSLLTKKAIARIARHQGEVSCVGIDPKSRYLFSCGDDGKTFGMDMANGKLALTLPYHPDSINDIAFNKTGQWVATASYDRKVSVYNLDLMQPLGKLRGHSKGVMKLAFISKNRLVSVDKLGSAIVWDLFDQSIITRLSIHDDVSAIAAEADGRFLFVGTKLGYVIAFDMLSYEMIARSYVKLSSRITSLFFDDEEDMLYIGSEGGDLYKYYIYEGIEVIKYLIQKREFKNVEEHLESNPILRYTEIYNLLEEIWEKTLKKARRLFERDKKDEALKLLEPYRQIPSKNSLINKLVEQYANFGKFYDLVRGGKYALAYSLAEQYPIYKESDLFHQLEEKWRKTFKEAQKLALDPRTMEQAKKLLMPFRGISEKAKAIQEMFVESDVYNRFKVALGEKDFKQVYVYLHSHPFLKNFPEYHMMMDHAKKLYDKAQEHLRKNDLVNALKYLRYVSEFEEYSEEVKRLIEDIDSRYKFLEAIKENNLSRAYEYLSKNEELAYSKEGQDLEQKWDKAALEANNYAAKGDALGVRDALGEFLEIKQKHAAIASIMAYAYRTQIEKAIRQKQPMQVIEQGFKNYVSNFGVDDHIKALFDIFKQRYKDSKLNLELLHEGSMSSWHPVMITLDILEEQT